MESESKPAKPPKDITKKLNEAIENEDSASIEKYINKIGCKKFEVDLTEALEMVLDGSSKKMLDDNNVPLFFTLYHILGQDRVTADLTNNLITTYGKDYEENQNAFEDLMNKIGKKGVTVDLTNLLKIIRLNDAELLLGKIGEKGVTVDLTNFLERLYKMSDYFEDFVVKIGKKGVTVNLTNLLDVAMNDNNAYYFYQVWKKVGQSGVTIDTKREPEWRRFSDLIMFIEMQKQLFELKIIYEEKNQSIERKNQSGEETEHQKESKPFSEICGCQDTTIHMLKFSEFAITKEHLANPLISDFIEDKLIPGLFLAQKESKALQEDLNKWRENQNNEQSRNKFLSSLNYFVLEGFGKKEVKQAIHRSVIHDFVKQTLKKMANKEHKSLGI